MITPEIVNRRVKIYRSNINDTLEEVDSFTYDMMGNENEVFVVSKIPLTSVKKESKMTLQQRIKQKFLESNLTEQPHLINAPNEVDAFDLALEDINPKTKENLISYFRKLFSGELIQGKQDEFLQLDTPEKKKEFVKNVYEDPIAPLYIKHHFKITLDELFGEISDLL
jgi:hypothetical protein